MKNLNTNININDLFVANIVSDDMVEIEPWVQYESFGRVMHNLTVRRKRILVYAKEEDGEVNYYSVKTGKKLHVVTKLYNHETRSTYFISILAHISRRSERNLFGAYINNIDLICCPVPFNEFAKENIGINGNNVSVNQASRLVTYYNLLMGNGHFELSDDEEESKQIISKKLGYSFDETTSKTKTKNK